MVLSKESQSTGAVTQTDPLLERAQEELTEQTALLENPSLESRYSVAFAALVEAKHDQVERIEDRLENLIEQQASRLQQTQSTQLGIFALPGTRTKWQSQCQKQQSAMQRLYGRLEAVREIKDGMGVHGPRLEELANRKLRAKEPGLVSEFDEMCVAQRQHQMLERKQVKDREKRERLGRGLSIGLSQAL